MDNELINILINYFEKDVKRIGHAMKVYSYGKAISESLEINERVLSGACLFHDIGIKVGEDRGEIVTGKMQERYGREKIGQVLAKTDYLESEIEIIASLIGRHHTYTNIDSIEYQILVEADFLVNIEEEIEMYENREKYFYLFKTEKGKEIFKTLYGE